MYMDDNKERTFEEKLEWMKLRYHERIGVDAKVAYVHPESLNGYKDGMFEGLTVIPMTSPLRPNHFVLCQTPEDYLAEKAAPLPSGG
jgi:hypothetical protein